MSRPGASAAVVFKVAQLDKANEGLALLNSLLVRPDALPAGVKYATMFGGAGSFVLTVKRDEAIKPGEVCVTARHRSWTGVKLGETVQLRAYEPAVHEVAQRITLELNLNGKMAATVNADELNKHLFDTYSGNIFSINEEVAFQLGKVVLIARVMDVVPADPLHPEAKPVKPADGVFKGVMRHDFTQIAFVKAPDTKLQLEGSTGIVQSAPILSHDFNFEDMGIGGLGKEFQEIFRRAFVSRLYPSNVVRQFGIPHVRGLLLYGPPGTGKTLMARQIGKMLKTREPKIVNGPEILNKYVGQAEENVRNLFKDAEIEYKAKGDDSALHMIIFDEIDAICKQRGSRNDGTGVGDSVVNQLLSKLDGVEQLNNILVIGMTNRKDLLDEALLRPGRLEVHIEISLPDENGRLEILRIHTSQMRKNNRLDKDVDLVNLSKETKNFSGAEIQGLVKAATSFAMNRHVNTENGVRAVDNESMKTTMTDFRSALNDVKPAFGVTDDDFETYAPNQIIRFSGTVDKILNEGRLFIEQARKSQRTPLVSLLLHGAPGSGTTALAAELAKLARDSEFPFVKFITPDKLVAYSEMTKCSLITKTFEDAFRSQASVVIVDCIERLIEYVGVGPRFSNMVLQTLSILMTRNPPKGHRLLVIATTSNRSVLEGLDMTQIFSGEIYVPTIQDLASVYGVVEDLKLFDEVERDQMKTLLQNAGVEKKLAVGVKKLVNLVERARQDPENKVIKFVEGMVQLAVHY